MRVAHYIADDLEQSKAFIAYIALCRKGKRWRAGACIHVPRSFTVAAISVINGISPGQSDFCLSNGFTEGCNNAIKTLKRVAFGFRSFRSFRARILLSLGAYPNF